MSNVFMYRARKKLAISLHLHLNFTKFSNFYRYTDTCLLFSLKIYDAKLKKLATQNKKFIYLTVDNIKQGYFDQKEHAAQGLFLIGTRINDTQVEHENFISDAKDATICFSKLTKENKDALLTNCYRLLKDNSTLSVTQKKQIEAFYYPCVAVFEGLTSYLAKKFELNKTIPQNFFFSLDKEAQTLVPAYTPINCCYDLQINEEVMKTLLPYLTPELIDKTNELNTNKLYSFQNRTALQKRINDLIKEVTDLISAIPDHSTCLNGFGIIKNARLYALLGYAVTVTAIVCESYSLFMSRHTIDQFPIIYTNTTNKAGDHIIKSERNYPAYIDVWETLSIVAIYISVIFFVALNGLIITWLFLSTFYINADDMKKINRFLTHLNDFLNDYTVEPGSETEQMITNLKNGFNTISQQMEIIQVKKTLKQHFEQPLRAVYSNTFENDGFTLFTRKKQVALTSQESSPEMSDDEEYDIEEGSESTPLIDFKPT